VKEGTDGASWPWMVSRTLATGLPSRAKIQRQDVGEAHHLVRGEEVQVLVQQGKSGIIRVGMGHWLPRNVLKRTLQGSVF